MPDPRKDILPAIGPENPGFDAVDLFRAEGSAADVQEIRCIGQALLLQDAVHVADKSDQLVNGPVPFPGGQLAVLPGPLQLVHDGVGGLFLPVSFPANGRA